MLIYEVNLTVNDDVAKEYKAWLKTHIDEILAIDGFHAAKMYQRDSDEAGGNGECWTIHYFLESREALNNYFDLHAEKMREDGLKRFGGKFSASRKVLEPMEKFVRSGEDFLQGE
ncbi:DUF4286 family protein [Porticoccaceae bacterium LTM1]|nr:DUF4286 family protein [Porticoccaceae bacterium LTM1]